MHCLLKTLVALVLLVSVLLAGLYVRSDLKPEVWQLAPRPALDGIFAQNNALKGMTQVSIDDATGPEDVAKSTDGFFYTGLADGRIMRFNAQHAAQEVINTKGRPLGLQFDHEGNLIIADAVRGLLKLTTENKLITLTDSVDGNKMLFVDDLDIATDGTIWFSDASMRYSFAHIASDFLEGSATGRLLSYSPETGQTRVQMSDLFFANGVALGPDEHYVLVNETGTGRIHRLWLRGARQGTRDVFFDGLPGNPDNLSFNGADTFWVALPAVRDAASEALSDQPFLRKLLGGLRLKQLPIKYPVGFVLGLNTAGEVTHVLHQAGDDFHSITSVNQWGQTLYLGSLSMHSVAMVTVPLPLVPLNPD